LLRVGSVLFGTGLLMVAFVAYQLWGTALYEHGAQSTLRQELRALLGREVVPGGSSGSPSSPSTAAARSSPATTSSTFRAAGPSLLPIGGRRATTTTSAPRPGTGRLGGAAPATTVPVLPERALPPASGATVPTRPTYRGYVAPASPDPSIGSPVGYLSIPKIGIDDAVVEGVGEAQLEQGPGHYPGTPLPGQAGNAAIAGHRTTYAAPFYDLNELGAGDPIYVQTTQGTFTYDVTQSFTVSPTDVSVLDPTPQPSLTLTTCNPRYSAAQRLVVQAELVASEPPPGAAPAAEPGPASAVAATAHRPSVLAGEQGLAGNGSSGGPAPAVAWGAATTSAGAALVVVRRRRRWPRALRLGATVVGTPLVLGLLYLFFTNVSAALPGSF
jgi:sortase A